MVILETCFGPYEEQWFLFCILLLIEFEARTLFRFSITYFGVDQLHKSTGCFSFKLCHPIYNDLVRPSREANSCAFSSTPHVCILGNRNKRTR